MTFIYGKWRALEKVKAIRDKYGENAEVIARDSLKEARKSGEKVEHSFPHLLNKTFKVPQYEVRKFEEKPVRTFLITDEQKAINALRRAPLEKTSFDD